MTLLRNVALFLPALKGRGFPRLIGDNSNHQVYYKLIISTQGIALPSKINWLISHTYPGSLVTQPWLTEHGIGYSLAHKYTQSGWLRKISAGVYYRPGASATEVPGWSDALHAALHQLHLPVHLAGLSSLAHQGLSHYLQLQSEPVWVGVPNRQLLPKWFREFKGQQWWYCTNSKLHNLCEQDFVTLPVNGKELTASCAELAAYEVVDAIGRLIRFEHAAELFQGLVNLRPRRVQSILERSHAVQTNRVFLFLSHLHGHQWARRLDEASINLGAGKRQVVAGGKLDERYQITVPESLIHNSLKHHE